MDFVESKDDIEKLMMDFGDGIKRTWYCDTAHIAGACEDKIEIGKKTQYKGYQYVERKGITWPENIGIEKKNAKEGYTLDAIRSGLKILELQWGVDTSYLEIKGLYQWTNEKYGKGKLLLIESCWEAPPEEGGDQDYYIIIAPYDIENDKR